jgi:hypothetical protein
MMGEREKRLTAAEARLAALQTAPAVLDLEVRRMEKEARRRIEEFAKVMTRNPDEARATLETLLGGPLRFGPVQAPEGKRFRIEGEIALESVFLSEGEGTGATKGRSRCPTKSVPSGIRTRVKMASYRRFPLVSRGFRGLMPMARPPKTARRADVSARTLVA